MTQRPPDPIPFPGDPVQRGAPPPQQQQQPPGPVIYSASGQPMRRVQQQPSTPPPEPVPLNRTPSPAQPAEPLQAEAEDNEPVSLHGHVAAVIDSTDASFAQDVIQRSHEIPVIVDCWAPWCGPCRVLGPVLEKLAYERDGQVQLVKVNTDENPQVAQALQVEGIPAVFAFVGGQLVNRFVGALPEEQVRAFFDSLIPSEADIKAAEGYRMLQENQIPIARLHFESALEEDPDHEPAGVGLAAVLSRIGENERAVELAKRWPNHPMSKSVLTAMELTAVLDGLDPDEVRRAAGTSPDDALARYRHGCLLAVEGQWMEALDELLESVKLDKTAQDEAARRTLLGIFGMMGDDQPVVVEYRKRLGRLLF
ncbi:MAG: thioredoxin [Chloroflexi bacterium]|nr:thioredoxin [Chloroflexota bacterium]MYD17626.1 thioredoxin [Chloroflexota bacterium]MYJ01960.1 thioredoxin [Chloroflexota bacterium]